MTVGELRAALADYDDDEPVDLDLIIDDLSYVVSALEQLADAAEVFGRCLDVEVEAFLDQAYVSL